MTIHSVLKERMYVTVLRYCDRVSGRVLQLPNVVIQACYLIICVHILEQGRAASAGHINKRLNDLMHSHHASLCDPGTKQLKEPSGVSACVDQEGRGKTQSPSTTLVTVTYSDVVIVY